MGRDRATAQERLSVACHGPLTHHGQHQRRTNQVPGIIQHPLLRLHGKAIEIRRHARDDGWIERLVVPADIGIARDPTGIRQHGEQRRDLLGTALLRQCRKQLLPFGIHMLLGEHRKPGIPGLLPAEQHDQHPEKPAIYRGIRIDEEALHLFNCRRGTSGVL